MKACILALVIILLYPAGIIAKPSAIDQIQKYLIPTDHPARPILDQIFSRQRVIASEETLKQAGFDFKTHLIPKIFVARHPDLEGYLIKTYLDNTPYPKEEWRILAQRIEGASRIQNTLRKHGYQDILKVPRKWIYPLPEESYEGAVRQYLLVVEDMHIVSPEENLMRYFCKMTKKKLKALHTVIAEDGLIDAVYIRNNPFCEDGKIAFIDTELFDVPQEKIYFGGLKAQLSPKLQKYWEKLCKNI